MKTCSKCGVEKPREAFSKDKKAKDGLQSRCKDCKREYRQQNRERFREYQRRYKQSNHERIAERDRERHREYYQQNRDRIAEKKREYYQQNRDRITERKREYYQQNRERASERTRKWQQANPHKVSAKSSRRRVRKRGTLTEWDLKLSAQWRKVVGEMPCYYCGTTDAEKYHIDHRIPVAKGGDDSWINLVRACEPCNLSKNAKTDAEFFGWS